jgi:hypothetical protein
MLPLLTLRGRVPGAMEVERGRVFAGVVGRAAGVAVPLLGLEALSLCSVLIGNLVLGMGH